MDGIQTAASPSEILSRFWLKRQKDASLLNEIFNHPSVFPHVNNNQTAPIDCAIYFTDPRNVCFASAEGAVIFHCRMPGIYEMHTGVLPGARGSRMIEGSRQAFFYMFTQTDCVEVLTHCPHGNSNAKAGALLAGMKYQWTSDRVYWSKGDLVDSDIYGVTVYDWWPSAPNLEQIGTWFHAALNETLRGIGKEPLPEPSDRMYRRIAGAAAAMIHGGQALTGISLYNRWASMAMRHLVQIVSLSPLVIDIMGIKLAVSAQHMEIIECP